LVTFICPAQDNPSQQIEQIRRWLAEGQLTGAADLCKRLDQNSALTPTERAAVSYFKGEIHFARGEFAEALREYQNAVMSSGSVPLYRAGLARLHVRQGHFSEAESDLRGAGTPGTSPASRAVIMSVSADLDQARGRYAPARQEYLQAISMLAVLNPPQPVDHAAALLGLGELDLAEEKLQEADKSLSDAYDLVKADFNTNRISPSIRDAQARLALANSEDLKDLRAAKSRLDEVAARRQRAGNPYEQAASFDHLGLYYVKIRDLRSAEDQLTKARSLRLKPDPNNPDVAISLRHLAVVYRLQKRYAEADRTLREARLMEERLFGPDSPITAETQFEQGQLALDQGRRADAEPFFVSWVSARGPDLSPNSTRLLQTLWTLSEIRMELHKYPDAEQSLRRIAAVGNGLPAASGVSVPLVHAKLADALYEQKKYEDAARYYESSSQFPPQSGDASAWDRLAECYRALRRPADAVRPLEKAVGIQRSSERLLALGYILTDLSRFDQAEPYVTEWLRLRGNSPPDREAVVMVEKLADHDYSAGEYKRAEPFLRQQLATLDASQTNGPVMNRTLERVADTCERLGKNREAAGFLERRAVQDPKALNVQNAATFLERAADLREREGGSVDAIHQNVVEADQIFQKALGVRSDTHVTVAKHLADYYRNSQPGKLTDWVEEWHLVAVKADPSDINRRRTQHEMVNDYRDNKQWKLLLGAAMDLVEEWKSENSPDKPNYYDGVLNMAIAHEYLQHYPDATNTFGELRKYWEKTNRKPWPEQTCNAYNAYASAVSQNGGPQKDREYRELQGQIKSKCPK
jgi:tetratricopeptide (TPR) repeat protein